MASLMVFGRRSASSCVTGTFEIYEVPKSPFVSTLTIYLPYWTRTGSFQPISSRSSSTASFVAPSPRIKPLASPGVRFMIRKMIKEMPRSTGIMVNRRLPINFSMFFHTPFHQCLCMCRKTAAHISCSFRAFPVRIVIKKEPLRPKQTNSTCARQIPAHFGRLSGLFCAYGCSGPAGVSAGRSLAEVCKK